MFARRLVKSSASLNLSRTFASTTPLCRVPSLADVTSSGVQSFDAKQKEFREKLAEQSKSKKETISQSSSSSSITPTAPHVSNASSSSDFRATDSQSIASEPATTETEESKAKGKLSSLIYGTKEGREMDQEMEHSFSQMLARGKYVHSIVFHEVKSDKVDEYVELVGSWYPKVASMPENKVHLVGSFRTEVGDCDTFGKSYHKTL